MELKKRRQNRFKADGYSADFGCWRCFLCSTADYNVACIESPLNAEGPYTLEIWDFPTEHWVEHATFPTLKEAKTVGRLLAGIALSQNF